MATNDRILDAVLQHQIQLLRYARGELKRIAPMLDKAEKALLAKLEARLSSARVNAGGYSQRRLEQLLVNLRELRAATLQDMKAKVRQSLNDLARSEAQFETKLITVHTPVVLKVAEPTAATLAALVAKQPFQGARFKEWFDRLAKLDQHRLTNAVRLGVSQGETVDQIVTRVRGTKAASYTDGALAATRRDAEAIVRTAVNSVSNGARDAVWKENSDIISQLRWTATLDGRTTPVCRARDGQVFNVDEGPRPPAHFNCRSVMVPVIDGNAAVGDRPFVRDTRTRQDRELDWRQQARDEFAADGDNRPSAKALDSRVAELRKQFIAEHIGQVPAATTYQDWLSKQPAAFQDETLGRTKGALFRRGGLTLDKFVNRAGDELTLEQLIARHPDAFKAAGVTLD